MKKKDPLLFRKDVPIAVIQQKVSETSKIPIADINLPDGKPGARRREFVTARYISMTLSKEFTRKSLSLIGMHHGGRDHATVLTAVKRTEELLSVRDKIIYYDYLESRKKVMAYDESQNEPSQEQLIFNVEK